MRITFRYFLLPIIFLIQGHFATAQNLVYDGDFNLSGAGWTTSCVSVEAWGFETTYGGPSSTNHVAEIDDEACMHQDVCILPGLSYTYSMDASRRIAGGPNPCISHIKITGLDITGTAVATFVDMDYTRTNTTFSLTPVTGIPVINVPPCSGIIKLRIDLTDNTPGYSTFGMIVDNISLIIATPLYITSPDTACANTPVSFSVPGAPPCIDYLWSFAGGAPSASLSATPAVTWSTPGLHTASVVLGNGTCDVVTLNYSIYIQTSVRDTIYAGTCAGVPYMFNGVPLYTAGVYTDTIPATGGGCDSMVTLFLSVNPKPSPPAVTNPVYCMHDTASPLAAAGSSLAWYGPGVTTAYTTAPVPSTVAPGKTIYYVTQSISGCTSDSAKITVTVNPIPAPPITKDDSYCQGSPAIPLTATGGDTLHWYTIPSGGTYTNTAPVPSTATPGIKTWYVSQFANGCESDRAPVNVTIIPTPSFSIGASHLDVCENDTVSLYYEGSAASHYSWSVPADAQFEAGAATGTYIVLRFNNIGSQHISLTVFDPSGACSATDTIKLNVVPRPSAQMYTQNNVCLGDTVALSLIARSYNADTFTWFVDNTPLYQSPAISIVAANSNSGGPYRFTWNDSGQHTITLYTSTAEGCRSANVIDSIKVNTLPNALFTFGPQTVCLEDSVYFKAVETNYGYNYQWSPGNFFNETNQPYIWGRMMDLTSRVTLTVTDPYGCKASSSLPVDVQPCCTIALPNAFTPNGDGRNDRYKPILTGHHKFHQFRIENRWGQTVFQSASDDFEWDGTFNGVPQDMGTYYYYLRYDCNGKTMEQKGDITLIR